MKYTQNYNLRKPEDTDPADIQDLNYNADEIDGKLKDIEDWEAAHLQASNPHSITPALIGAETPQGAQARVDVVAGRVDALEQDYSEHKSDYEMHKDTVKLKVAKLEQEVKRYKELYEQSNPTQSPRVTSTGYGVVSLPKNAANGQISVSVKGNTWTNRAGIGDTSPQTIENLDSAKTYLLIKTDGGTVNVDAVDTAVPAKITGKTSTVLTWASGKIALYELSTAEAALTEAQLGARYHYVSGTKSTICGKTVSVNKNLISTNLTDWEQGTISPTTGENATVTTRLRNKKFARVGGLRTVKISVAAGYGSISYFEYDVNKSFLRYTSSAMGHTGITTLSNTKYIRTIISKGDGTDTITVNDDLLLAKPQLEYNTVATTWEPNIETSSYTPSGEPLRSLPNGTKDEISNGKHIQRIGTKTNVVSGTVINYADMADGGQYYAWNDNGETETGIKGDTLGIDATQLTYQLATPIEIPIQTSGSLVSYPSGTVYIEPFVADAGIYTDKMSVLHQDLPIKALEKISKVDFETGVETELDPAQAIIAADKLSFTHPDLEAGDIVFFVYEYDRESTVGETEIEYYDSRYTIKDSVTDKFYKWNVTVADGVPSIELVEV